MQCLRVALEVNVLVTHMSKFVFVMPVVFGKVISGVVKSNACPLPSLCDPPRIDTMWRNRLGLVYRLADQQTRPTDVCLAAGMHY